MIRALELKDLNASERFDIPLQVKLADPGDVAAGTIEGYGSVFKMLDRGGDIVMPGAFKASLADWKKKGELPPMLWQHDPSMPIGVWTDMEEDDKGLRVKGELILEVPQGKIVHALLKKDAIKGMSIGYQTKDYEYDRNTGARRLKKVDLWELSLVTFPMLPEAQVSAVKASERSNNFNPRDMEGALRDAGLSRAESVKATAIFREWLQRDVGETENKHRDDARDVLMMLRKAQEALRS